MMFHLPASRATTFRSLPPFLVLFSMLALPASADWLVCHDGERIETRGPWRVKRSAVVFTTANGTLSSLRRADVDLMASERATAEAQAPAAAPEPAPAVEPEKRTPVLVLTNDSVGRAAVPAEAETEKETAAPEPPAETEPPPVEVVAWRQVEGDDGAGLEIRGTLRSHSPGIVTGVGVHVSLFDAGGERIARRDAFVDAASIAARSTTGFRALFPGVDRIDGEPVFEARGQELTFETVGESRESELDAF